MKIEVNALRDYLPLLQNKKKLFVLISVLILLLGALHIIFLPSEWTAKSRVVYVYQEEGSSPLSSNPILSNLNIGNNEGVSISPLLFNDIIYSRESLNEILRQEIRYNNQYLTVKEYLERYQRLGFMGRTTKSLNSIYTSLLGVFIGNTTDDEININEDDYTEYRQSRKERALHGILKRNIDITFFDQTGLIEISSTFQMKEATVVIVNHVERYLNDYLTGFKNSKLINKQSYLSKQIVMISDQLDSAREAYANYQQRNKNLISYNEIFRKNQFESDYQRIFQAYTELQQQLQASEVAMAEANPAFFKIENAVIPTKKSSTSRLALLLFFMVFAPVFSAFLVIFIQLMKNK